MRDIWDTPASVIRQLAANLNTDASGLATILNNASDEERERLLNEADAPLQARKQMERSDRFFASAGHVQRGEGGYAWLTCSAEGCIVQPHDSNGLPVQVNLRRWWCGRHADQAQPGDAEPWQSPIAVGPFGLIDTEREAIERAQAEREEARLKACRELERQEREQLARDLPPMDDSPWLPSGPGWS